jgi:Mg-chelatase subunit ChlD
MFIRDSSPSSRKQLTLNNQSNITTRNHLNLFFIKTKEVKNMKTKKLALLLFTLTTITVFALPYYKNASAVSVNTPINPTTTNTIQSPIAQHPKIEVVFVLDTTSSMSGMIQAAKEKIWSIASSMASAQNSPDIKMGLIAFRDRGDAYVTKLIDLSTDLDTMNASLMDFQAQGGGDGPESVNQALYEAVNNISWSADQQTYKVIFLIGDAPPHTDYNNDIQYAQSMQIAHRKGIVVNTIQSGQQAATTSKWQHIAMLGKGRYFQVEQGGNAVAISTPYDKQIAALSSKLDDTRLYYGDKTMQKQQQAKVQAGKKLNAKASTPTLARRAMFNSTTAGERNFLGESELVDAISSGRIELSSIEKKQLPTAMQAMSPEKQSLLLLSKSKQRKELKREIATLAEKRSKHIKQELDASDGAKDSLDEQIYSTVRDQASKKGFVYESDSAKY